MTLNWIDRRWIDLLANPFDKPFFTQHRLQSYADAIRRRTGAALNIWGFIDGTVRPMCRPSVLQRPFYNGHKRTHALKYQAVASPDGLMIHLYGPVEGRRHDAGILAESNLLAKLQQLPDPDDGGIFALYGDPAYPLSPRLQKAYLGANLTPAQAQFNTLVNRARQSVEWSFGELLTYWAYVDYKKQQKLLLQPVAIYYRVGALLINCRVIIQRGNKTSKYFDI
eukprot:scpid29032/ scgid11272/ 